MSVTSRAAHRTGGCHTAQSSRCVAPSVRRTLVVPSVSGGSALNRQRISTALRAEAGLFASRVDQASWCGHQRRV